MWSKSASCGGWLLKALCSALQCCSRSSTSLYQSSNSNCSSIYYKAARNLQDKLKGWWWGVEGKHQESLSSMVNVLVLILLLVVGLCRRLFYEHYTMTTIYYTSEFIREFILFRAYLPTRNDEEKKNMNSTHNKGKSFRTHSFFGYSHISQEMGRLTLK